VLRRRRSGTSVTPLALIGAGAVLALLLVAYLVGLVDLIRASIGLAIVIAPGLALAITRRPASALPQLDLFLIAAAVSLACVAIGGLVLNLLPVGLSRFSWLGLVGALLLGTAVLARGTLPPLQRETWVRPKTGQALAMAAAAVLVVVALAIAHVGVKQPTEPFSALWVVPDSPGMVEIGLDNREGATTTYRVDVTVDGRVTASFSSVTIAPGEGWTTVLSEPVPGGSGMEVLVFVASNPGVVYRRVTFTPGAAATGANT
jgi:hypothetical protein